MECNKYSISEIRDFYDNCQIELNPPYQRKPAWKRKQRILLLSSIFNGIPIPALIFNKKWDSEKHKDVYYVLDGKQRLETILNFIGFKININDDNKLFVEFKNPKTNKNDKLYFNELKQKKVAREYENILKDFYQYKIPVIEYSDDSLRDIFGRNVAEKEVFVRINSTGSPLKSHEIRHAKSVGPFFELGDHFERKYQNDHQVQKKVLQI